MVGGQLLTEPGTWGEACGLETERHGLVLANRWSMMKALRQNGLTLKVSVCKKKKKR